MAVFVIAVSCDTLMDVDSGQVVFPGDHRLNTPGEIGYPMIGIFTQLEKLADSYLLLGELRGDLMDITENTRPDLREIYDFDISPGNRFNRIEDYYAVINNCNYLIRNVDTSIVLGAEKVMYREFAAAKAVRAWTYMQIALNYGTATYYEDPIMNVNDAEQPYPEYTLEELAPVLIADLEPWKDIQRPESISLGEDMSSSNLYFPVAFLLGDLHLWMGEYEEAAMEYYDLMAEQEFLIHEFFQSTWSVINGVFVIPESINWWFLFGLNSSNVEQITMIAASTEFGQGSFLDSVMYNNFEVAPSEVSISNWEDQVYYHNSTAVNQGDLRALGSYFDSDIITSSGTIFSFGTGLPEPGIIGKYISMSTSTSRAVYIYRSGLLYLRYAEAVNRAGKPNLAFAVLKNGLSRETMETDTLVPPAEKYLNPADSTLYSYMDFSDIMFESNIGVHARGCGNTHLSPEYRLPSLPDLQDSIDYVEELIVTELALETAFEGNRFHDLMRISLRHGGTDYLADKVAAKYAEEGREEEIRVLLQNQQNWYLPR
jgi:hypothetical protein